MQLLKKIFVLGALCLGLVFTLPADTNLENLNEQELKGLIDGLINTTINKILAGLNETIEVDALSLNLSTGAIIGDANISSFKLSGLKNLVATKIDVAVLSLALNATIVVPELTISTKYYADVVVAELIPLYGSGRAGITLDDIEIALGGKVSISGGLKITNVTILLSLEDSVFDLHGLLNNEDFSSLVNQVLNDNVADFLNDNKEVIGSILSPLAQTLINSILG